MIDVPTAVTGPPEVWEPGFPRRPSSIPALVALVLLVVSSAAVVAGLYRALEVRYTPRADVCAGLDAGAIAALARGPAPVTGPGRLTGSCEFTVAKAAAGSLSLTYATSTIEARVVYASGGDSERQPLPGVGQDAWVTVDPTNTLLGTCRVWSVAQDANLIVHLDLVLLSALCDPDTARPAVAAGLRAAFTRLA